MTTGATSAPSFFCWSDVMISPVTCCGPLDYIAATGDGVSRSSIASRAIVPSGCLRLY